MQHKHCGLHDFTNQNAGILACAHTPPAFELLAVNTAEAATQQQGKNKRSSQNGP